MAKVTFKEAPISCSAYQRYFYFQYHQNSGESKIFQNVSFAVLGLPLK